MPLAECRHRHPTLSIRLQWLMYWVCYATLTTLESVAWGFLIW